jgi:hypothetical protein
LNIERLSLVLLKVAKDAKAQALLPAGPTGLQSEQQGQGQALQHWSPAGSAGLPAVARSAKEGSFLRVLCDLLNSAVVTMHGGLKLAAFGTGLQCKF